MDTIVGKNLQNERVQIDNKSFINCTLTHCTLEYHGEPVSFYATRLSKCQYIFLGSAKRTLMFLQETGLMPIDPAEWGETDGKGQPDGEHKDGKHTDGEHTGGPIGDGGAS